MNEIIVKGADILLPYPITIDQLNASLHFSFDTEWDVFSKVVHFHYFESPTIDVEISGEDTLIPIEVIASPFITFSISGTDRNGRRMATKEINLPCSVTHSV